MFFLYGSSVGTLTNSTNFNYDNSLLTLQVQRLMGAYPIAVGSEYIGATGYFISTTGTDASSTKTINTINGVYVFKCFFSCSFRF